MQAPHDPVDRGDARIARSVRPAVAARAPGVAERGVEALAREPDAVGRVGEEHLGAEDAGSRAHAGHRVELAHGFGRERRVVVQEQHPVGASLERGADADVVAAGVAEVAPVLDQRDGGELRPDGVG